MSDLTKFVRKSKKVVIDEKEYTLTALNLKDWAELHEFAEEKFFEDMEKRLKVLPPDSKQFNDLADKIANAKKSDIIQGMMDYLSDVNASRLTLYLMLKHNHSDITQEEVDNLSLTYGQFLDVAEGLQGKGENESPPEQAKH